MFLGKEHFYDICIAQFYLQRVCRRNPVEALSVSKQVAFDHPAMERYGLHDHTPDTHRVNNLLEPLHQNGRVGLRIDKGQSWDLVYLAVNFFSDRSQLLQFALHIFNDLNVVLVLLNPMLLLR